MSKRQPERAKLPQASNALLSALTVPLSGAYFLTVCLCSASTVKRASMIFIALTAALAFLCFQNLRDRITPPLLALTLYAALCGVSTFYAVAGKFALYEFLKVLCALCLTLILLAVAPGQGVRPGRWIASILEGYTAIASLVSLDMIATRYLSDWVLELLASVTPDYAEVMQTVVSSLRGARLSSLFTNPNIFAGVAGIGVMLSLGLVMSSSSKKERCIHTVCLYVTSLVFVLAMSRGGIATIGVAFLLYLALESRERRSRLFILMVETLLLTLGSVAVITSTSYGEWTGPNWTPLVCAALGAAALCVVEQVNNWLADKLRGHGRIGLAFTGLAVVLAGVYAFLAFRLTGPAELEPGEYLTRALYPEPGTYSLSVQADGPVNVHIYSYDMQQLLTVGNTSLYSGGADGAEFTVPEGAMSVFFRFSAGEAVTVEAAGFQGAAGEEETEIPLAYKLLPEVLVARFQGARASNTFIERITLFADGIKLFRRSPVLGLGLGGYENGLKSVQSFYLETKYAHSHYVQALCDTGAVGFVLFVGLLVTSAAGILLVRRKGSFSPMVSALGGALAFMAGHAAVEVDFSIYCFLPIAYATFALIGLFTEEAFPQFPKKRAVQTGAVLVVSVLLIVFGVLLNENMRARSLVTRETTAESLSAAIRMDKFEWADYMLTFVLAGMDPNVEEEVRFQADEYAERLSRVDSNTIPLYLARYYFTTGRTERGLEMAEKYVLYTACDAKTWQSAFEVLEEFEEDSDVYRTGVARIADDLDQWNEEHLGKISLNERSAAFVARMRTEENG